jgi:hypothetical protein
MLSQLKPDHPISPYIFKINFNIIIPYILYLTKGLRPSEFPTDILCAFLISPICATSPAHTILLYFIKLTVPGKNKNYESPHYEILSSYVNFVLLDLNIIPNTLSAFSSHISVFP